jgi:phosphate/sulfate permease
MKRVSIMALCVGAVLGAALASVLIWLWQTLTGNISVIAIVVTVIVAAVVFVYCELRRRITVKKAVESYCYELEKYKSYYRLFSSWMVLKNKGRMLAEYFEDRKFNNIAIYGLGKLGLCLYEELKGSKINVKYAIDINVTHFSYLNLRVVSCENQLEMVDVIVVTPVLEYEKIVEELRKKTSCHIANLEDVISSM